MNERIKGKLGDESKRKVGRKSAYSFKIRKMEHLQKKDPIKDEEELEKWNRFKRERLLSVLKELSALLGLGFLNSLSFFIELSSKLALTK